MRHALVTLAVLSLCTTPAAAEKPKAPPKPAAKTKVAPIKAALSCAFKAQDGKVFKWPGNGTKAKLRIEDVVDCAILIPAVPAGQELKGSIKGKGKAHEAPLAKLPAPNPDTMRVVNVKLSSESGDFEGCMDFTVEGKLTSGGQTVFSSKLGIKQYCPD